MTIYQRIDEIKSMNKYLLHKCSLDKVENNCVIVIIDYWLKRTQGNKKKAQLYTERYVVENYNTQDEEIWLDDTNIVQMVRMKKW